MIEATGRHLIAYRYPSADAAIASWDRLAKHFARDHAVAITTMRSIGASDVCESHMVVAAGFSDEDAGLLELAPWGDDAKRWDEDIPDLIAQRLWARAARNAATLAAAGRRGSLPPRRGESERLRSGA
jgi:hypothetical protein